MPETPRKRALALGRELINIYWDEIGVEGDVNEGALEKRCADLIEAALREAEERGKYLDTIPRTNPYVRNKGAM